MYYIVHKEHHGDFTSPFYHFLSWPSRVCRVTAITAQHKTILYCCIPRWYIWPLCTIEIVFDWSQLMLTSLLSQNFNILLHLKTFADNKWHFSENFQKTVRLKTSKSTVGLFLSKQSMSWRLFWIQFSESMGLLSRGTSEIQLGDLSFGPQDLHTYLNQSSSGPNYF